MVLHCIKKKVEQWLTYIAEFRLPIPILRAVYVQT